MIAGFGRTAASVSLTGTIGFVESLSSSSLDDVSVAMISFDIGFFAPLDEAVVRLLELDLRELRGCRTGVRLALSFFGVVFRVDGDINFASRDGVVFCGLAGSLISLGGGNGTFRGRPRFLLTSIDLDRLRRAFAPRLLSASSSLLSLSVDLPAVACFRFRRVEDIRLDTLSFFSSSVQKIIWEKIVNVSG